MASLPLLRLLALALAVAGMAVAEEGGRFKPVDTDCMTWHYVTKGTYSPSKDGPPLVVGRQHKLGDVASTPSLQMVCASPEGQIGHFDWNGMGRHGKMQSDRCHIHGSPAIHLPPPWWIATYATSNLSWSDASQGQRVPSNAYQIGGLHLGRNIPTDPAKDKKLGGNVLPGWVVVKNGLLGELMYRDWDNKVEESYEIATCHKPTLLRYRCDNETSRCVTVNATGSNSSCADAQTGCAAAVSGGLLSCATDLCPTCPKKHLCDKTCQFCGSNSSNSSSANASTFPTQQACAAACIAPPPPPLSKNPCIRFGHAIPSEHHVDVEIVQDPPGPNISHTWTNFKFTDFSDWVNVFKPGSGTITIWENVGGVRGAQIYSLPKIPLTPGPLLVVIKVAASQVKNASGFWPPSLPDAVEAIAASYVDTDRTSKVRLLNLSPDTKQAGMTCSGNGTNEIASGVDYGLGSDWAAVATASATFGFVDDAEKKVLTSRTITPAAAPIGNTNVLLGLQSGSGTLGIQAVALVDAPEGGTCHP